MTTKAKSLTPAPIDSAIPLVEHIPASQFRRAPDNRIITAEQIAKMSVSVRGVGLLQPITARPVDNPDTGGKDLEIVMGECRWRGCLDIDENYLVPCFIRDLSDKDSSKIRAIENFQRKDLDEIEEARAIQNLRDNGWSVNEIADFLGRKKDHIYQRITLLRLSDEAHLALREGNISIHTAVKLANLPEDKRDEALKAVVTPTHAAKALPERQALDLIEREFIEPEKRARAWNNRRNAITENHPGAKWNAYEEARGLDTYSSDYVRSDRKPEPRLLSDAARDEQLIIPTWGELAKKHGAQLVIGCDYHDEAHTYVKPQPIIDAEKAACSENPADCIFIHEAAVHQARKASEQRKRDEEAHTAAIESEKEKIASFILAPECINKTATKKLVELSFIDVSENYAELSDYADVLGIDCDAEGGEEKAEAAVLKYLRSKILTPYEAADRLKVATWAKKSYPASICEILFESGAMKPGDFPAFHRAYLERLAVNAAFKRDQEAARAAKAAGETAA